MGRPALGVLATALVLLCGTAAAEFDGYNGMPRPAGMDQDPTTTYGPKPAVKYDNKPANCIWYGWENGNYPPEGTKNCSSSLWASLTAANPAGLAGFMYYVPLDDIYYDPSYNEYLCAIGCFDLSASGPAPTNTPVADSPGSTPLPPAVPPVVSAPPPVKLTPSTPPSVAPPPPATLFRPPPPAPPLPPVTAPAPASIVTPQSPGLSPISSPGASVPGSPVVASGPGPSVVQTGSGSSTSVSTVLKYIVALILAINLLV